MDLDGRCFIRKGNAFVPADLAAEELLRSCKEGKEVLFTIRKARNPIAHRWFFKCLSVVVENSKMWRSVEQLLDVLKIETGHTVPVMRLNGEIMQFPKSINFGAMDEVQFTEWRNKALDLLAPVIGVHPSELLKEIDKDQKWRDG